MLHYVQYSTCSVLTSKAMSISAVAVCVVLATWVGCTRVYEYWHHPVDVACGAVLGIACALIAYYPMRTSPTAEAAYGGFKEK